MNTAFLFLSYIFGFIASTAIAADVDKVLASMTLEEKIGQMVQIDIALFLEPETSTVNFTMVNEWIKKYHIGSLLNTPFSGGPIGEEYTWSPQQWRDVIVKIQNLVVTNGGAAIPIIYGIDSIHGASYVGGAALFPQQLALAATFEPEFARTCGKITSKDTRVAAIPWLFSPVLGTALNPLWSRFYETFGEDPYLISIMGAALIEGYQYDAEDGGLPARAAACMKHFIAYSDPVNGHDRSPVELAHRMVKELYGQQFKAAVDAGVMTAMESYQEVGGVPMVSSRDYLKKLLRVEMNFTGFMVTDYMEIENLHTWHMVSSSQKNAVQLVLEDTSVDQSMVPLDSSFFDYTLELVQAGVIPESRIDDSTRKILNVKNILGLLDDPVPPSTHPLMDTVGQSSDWNAALDAARSSITLLKNDDGVLPKRSADTKLFVTGPTCDSLTRQSGGWSIHWQGAQSDNEFSTGVTVLAGLRKLFTTVEYIEGPAIDAQDLENINQTAILNAADAADIVVVCIGEETYTEKPGDIDDLNLAAGQSQYLSFLNSSSSTPIVTIIISGRPRLLNGCKETSDAVLEAYLPGPMGGQAVAEIIQGIVVPSGRIPFSYPKYPGAVPYPYHHKPGNKCTNPDNGFEYITCEVEWAFGSGLSYTTFEYTNMIISPSVFTENDDIIVSVDVQNTGTVDANHTVMLFVVDMYRRVTPEYKSLKGFTKIFLKAGQTQSVTFTLNAESLQYAGVDGWYLLESGEFRFTIGPETDCRANQTAVPSGCLSSTLQTSANYYPVCDYGCSLWSSGVLCGHTESTSTCRTTCINQGWDWNYIGCLEEYATGSCASGPEAQCFDAFSTPSPTPDSSSEDCIGYISEQDSGLYVAFATIGGTIFGACVTIVFMYWFLNGASKLNSKSESLLENVETRTSQY